MTPDTRRLTGVISGGAAGTPFAIVAASHGIAGLIMGGLVVIATAAIGRHAVVRTLTQGDEGAAARLLDDDNLDCQLSITTGRWRLTMSNRGTRDFSRRPARTRR